METPSSRLCSWNGGQSKTSKKSKEESQCLTFGGQFEERGGRGTSGLTVRLTLKGGSGGDWETMADF